MTSDLQKLSKGLIIYSALLSGFEKPDFKNDALAGVRANYFNSGCLAQTEKTEVAVEKRQCALSYSMNGGSALMWKMTCEGNPMQTVKRYDGGVYCVLCYNNDGAVFKRQYFDLDHSWLRTEYYDAVHVSSLSAVISPGVLNGVLTLIEEKITTDGTKNRSVLFPSFKNPRKKCEALVYSNSGMIWFDASFRPSDFEESEQAGDQGFVFEEVDFTSQTAEPGFDLRSAPVLTQADVDAAVQANKRQSAPETSEKKLYSAYDRIEEILLEAQKTNKNIFGTIADLADSGEFAGEDEKQEPGNNESSGEQDLNEATEPESGDDVESADSEKAADRLISACGEVYSYFGALEGGLRQGRGRTVSSDGVTVYDGEYFADKRQGFGISYYKDGSANYAGSWESGNRTGCGTGYRRSDSTMHAGRWRNNSPDGVGARFDKDGGFIDVCMYSNGVRNGKSVRFDEEGNVIIGIWSGGELVSEIMVEGPSQQE